MRKSTYIFVVLLIGVVLTSLSTNAEKAIIISQPNSPIEIYQYNASYSFIDREIKHHIKVRNASKQEIVAYRVQFHTFDVFNELMGRGLGGISIEDVSPGHYQTGTWSHQPYAAFEFESHGTGISYVSDVRFVDGTVWKFNRKLILSEFQKIQQDLTEDIFESGE